MENLWEIARNAKSYENREAWKSTGNVHSVGSVEKDGRIYDICQDEAGDYFYTVRIMTESGPKSEYEAIFGEPEPITHHKSIERKTMIYEKKTK